MGEAGRWQSICHDRWSTFHEALQPQLPRSIAKSRWVLINYFVTAACNNGLMVLRSPKLVQLLVKAGLSLLVVNEVRGLILAAPVLYGMYEAGGTIMAVWLGFCSLAGIALSVIGPLFVAKKFKLV